MLWAGTPVVGLGPRHIDWGPGGCARRSLLFGHSLNVGRAATAACVPASRRRSSSPSKRRGTPDHSNRRIRLSNFHWLPNPTIEIIIQTSNKTYYSAFAVRTFPRIAKSSAGRRIPVAFHVILIVCHCCHACDMALQ